MLWRSMAQEQLTQLIKDVTRVEFALNTDRQAFPRELINDAKHTEDLSVMGTILNEVIGPNMPPARWPQANARSIAQP